MNIKDQYKKIDLSKLPKEILFEINEIKEDTKGFTDVPDFIKNDWKILYNDIILKKYKDAIIKPKTTKVAPKTKSKTTKVVPKMKKTVSKKINKTVKIVKKSVTPVKKQSVTKAKTKVAHYTEEDKLIRRFHNTIKKPFSFRKVQLLFMAFEKSIAAQKVRKSTASKLFKDVNKTLVNLFNYMEVDRVSEISKLNLKSKTLENQLEKYVNSKEVDYSVRLINRYINTQGTKLTIPKTENLIKAIDSAIKTKKILKTNRLYSEIVEAKKSLQDYLSSRQKKVKIKEVPLSGVKKKSKKKVKTTLSGVKPPRVRSIDYKGNSKPEFYKVNGSVGKFLQAVERKPIDSVVITLDGSQGAGKTTALYKFMNAFAGAENKSLFISGEEHPLSSLAQEKVSKHLTPKAIQYLDVIADVNNVNELYNLVDGYDVIFIDSWQKLLRMVGTIRLDEDLRKKINGKVFVIIFQQTTTGRTKGGAEVVFDGDIIIKMVKEDSFKDNYAYFDKNRYTKIPIENIRYNIATGKVYNPNI